jgi:hypothetical protein
MLVNSVLGDAYAAAPSAALRGIENNPPRRSFQLFAVLHVGAQLHGYILHCKSDALPTDIRMSKLFYLERHVRVLAVLADADDEAVIFRNDIDAAMHANLLLYFCQR